MSHLTTLGIDPGLTNVGLCLLDAGGVVDEQVITPKGLRGVTRLDYIARALEEFIDGDTIDLVAIEGYDYKGFSTIPLAEANAVLQLVCHRQGCKHLHVSPAQVKKFATGNSQASKADMMTRYSHTNEHLADARALAEIAMGVLSGRSAVRHELEVIQRLRNVKPKKKAPTIKKLGSRGVAL